MRPLTSRERDVISAMLEKAEPIDSDGPVTNSDRARWADQLSSTRAGVPCSCGTCPSINLTDALGRTPDPSDDRIVLAAGCDEGLLLLFIDDDVLSYLELAPMDDLEVASFPSPEKILFET